MHTSPDRPLAHPSELQTNYSRLSRFFGTAISFLAAAYILEFAILAFIRMLYPYELEWSESATVAEVRWIVDGHPLYTAPTINFLPLAYTPVYFYLSAAVAKFTGPSFLAPRLISILAATGCFVLIYIIVYQRTRRIDSGLLAAGIYAASFRFSGAWMDLAKADSLFLLILMLAFWVSTRYPNYAGLLVSGSLYTLAYFTKQITLPVVLVLSPISLLLSRGRSWLQWFSAFALATGFFWLFDATSAGWYSFYTFDTLLYHERVLYLWQFWATLLGKMWPAALLVFLFAVLSYQSVRLRAHQWQDVPWMYLGFAVALILASWSIFFKVWTYDNAYMPASIGFALLSGLTYGSLMSFSKETRFSHKYQTGLPLIANTLLLIQLGTLFYNPVHQIPTTESRQQTQDFIHFVQNLPGRVWVFSHTQYGYLAGKDTYFHSVPFGDIVGGRTPPPRTDAYQRREMAADVFQSAISEQYFDWIIIDKLEPYWVPYYEAVDLLPYEFYPVTGASTSPQILLTRNPANQGSGFPNQ